MKGKGGDVPFDQFYAAIGRAHTSWAMLEDGLRDVFTRLVICSIAGTMISSSNEQLSLMGMIFHSSTNLRARLVLISDIIAQFVKDPAIISEWNSINNKINDKYKNRNILAHGAVWGNDQEASYISEAFFASRKRSLTYNQVCACDQSFKKLAERLTKLAIAINEHLVERAKGRP